MQQEKQLSFTILYKRQIKWRRKQVKTFDNMDLLSACVLYKSACFGWAYCLLISADIQCMTSFVPQKSSLQNEGRRCFIRSAGNKSGWESKARVWSLRKKCEANGLTSLQSRTEQKMSVLVLWDLCAAFDTGDHYILLLRIKTWRGIKWVCLKLLWSLLVRSISIITNPLHRSKAFMEFNKVQWSFSPWIKLPGITQ